MAVSIQIAKFKLRIHQYQWRAISLNLMLAKITCKRDIYVSHLKINNYGVVWPASPLISPSPIIILSFIKPQHNE
jgi:hypothetical protein